MWRHCCNAAHISTILDQQIQVHFSAWWHIPSNTRDTSCCLITAQLEAAPNSRAACCSTFTASCKLHVYSTQLSLAGSATSSLQRFEFCLAPFSFWGGAGNNLPQPPTAIHNTPVLVETISWLGHTKAAALFGNKLLKRSWEQPQTLQQNLKQSQPGLPVSHKHKERSILGESSQTGLRQTDPLGAQL